MYMANAKHFALGTQRILYSTDSCWGLELGVTQILGLALGETQILRLYSTGQRQCLALAIKPNASEMHMSRKWFYLYSIKIFNKN